MGVRLRAQQCVERAQVALQASQDRMRRAETAIAREYARAARQQANVARSVREGDRRPVPQHPDFTQLAVRVSAMRKRTAAAATQAAGRRGPRGGAPGPRNRAEIQQLLTWAKESGCSQHSCPNYPATAPLGDRLVATANAAKYTGDITGRLDGPTALALQAWQANGYTCPVVAESRDQQGGLVVDNVWFGSEDAQKGHRCWVTDLTSTYNVDPARIAAQGALATAGTHPRILVGSYTTSGFGNGPVCERATAWTNNAIAHGTDITIETRPTTRTRTTTRPPGHTART